MKKGFTLVELLAVIVILAIIALIATPIILDIIGDTKKESDKRSKELYLDAVNQAIARKNLVSGFNPKTCTVKSNGNLNCYGEELKVEVEGFKPCGGSITLNNGIVKEETLKFTCEPIPEAKSFSEDSWATIIANVREGTTEKYNVGDEKEVTLKGEEFEGKSYTVRIANKTDGKEGCERDDFSETACGFVVEFVDIINLYVMNETLSTWGGWKNSVMREYLNVIDGKEGSGTIYNALPDEIKDGIKETKVISGHEKWVSTNYITTDKIYLLSLHEVYEDETSKKTSKYDTAWDKTRQLDYYKWQNVTTDSYEGAIKKYQSVAKEWWLRSASSGNTSTFHNVNTTGSISSTTAYSASGAAPAFRIG